MNLLDYMSEQKKETESPLASRLRPTTLDEVVGQKHIIGKDKLLYRAIQADKLSSLIFYGPPGTGKTTLLKKQKKTGGLMGARRFCLLTRFTALIKASRTICFRLLKTVPLS